MTSESIESYPVWHIRGRVLSTRHHTLIMGVLNATPDSFSDGGRYAVAAVAVAAGIDMWNQGADVIDVGGESTRPGAEPVSVEEELDRVVPVVSGLVEHGVVVSVDTMKAAVAAAAVTAGAHIVNDVTALGDPDMAAVCAGSGVGVVLMHMKGNPQTMQIAPHYESLVPEVVTYLNARAGAAQRAGVERERICLDPGIGFGKTHAHNIELLNNIGMLAESGYPVLVGTSRKGFLGAVLSAAGLETVAAERDPATTATVALAIAGGASIVRVHNVGHAFQAARVADAIVRASQRRL
jgi:dihydropteroate synthase